MKKLIVANWKMQLPYKDSISLAKALARGLKGSKREVVICPDYLSFGPVSDILKKTELKLGAQDSAAGVRGALTGESSPADLKSLGARYVILGHSERREHLHENSAIINEKIKAALAEKLVPILCVGEKLSEKESGQTKRYLLEELRHALQGVKIGRAEDLVIAYEPIWAISTSKNGRAVPAAEAGKIQSFLKVRAAAILKKKVRVLYGGSVNAKNAGEFLVRKDIDGLLVGAASLNFKEFSQIC